MKCPQCQAENPDQSKYCAECGTRIQGTRTESERIQNMSPNSEVMFSKTMTLETGTRVLGEGKIFGGKYEITGELGQGGMGIVYKAKDIKLKRTVALKFLPTEFMRALEAKERFIREAQAAAALNHPNICTIYEVAEADGQPYIAMEYVEGQSLRQKIIDKPMEADAVADLAVQVASGLEAAHQRGIIHRDIKSGNIMVTEKGQAKIMDFGLAKVIGQERLTKEAVTIGTVAYMSPEQAQGEDLDRRTDLWSFGVVLYEMLTGQLPFRGDRESIILHSIVKAEPKPARQIKPDIPVELQKVMEKALKKNRDDRYASAGEMAVDLKRYLEARRAEEAGFFNLKSLARRIKKPVYYIPAAVILIAAAAFGYYLIHRNAQIRWARRVALPEIQRLYQESKFAEALKIAVRAEKYIAEDAEFKERLSSIAGELAVDSDPPGASVSIRAYMCKEAPWELIGQTPIPSLRLAAEVWRFRFEKAGYETLETWYQVGPKSYDNTDWKNTPFKVTLNSQGNTPPGMTRIPMSNDNVPDQDFIRPAFPDPLPDYFIDRYEVTNKEYKAFMDGGGYRDRKYWKNPFGRAGRTIPWDEAMKLFVDKTGVPGPAGWELGDYPKGQDDFPVSGVSWFEAAAYAEFAGKTLPSAYHWAKPVANSQVTTYALLPLSNFGSNGPAPVGLSQAVSLGDTYDQCGNVKEWCWNAWGDMRLILGGAWNEPSYMGYTVDASDPFRRESNFGFRCMKLIGDPGPAAKAFDPIPVRTETDYAKLTPCSDEVFSVVRGIFAYPKSDFEAKVEFRREFSEYAFLEKVSFWDSHHRQKIYAYIFLPRKSRPPFQTVFYYGGGHAWHIKDLSEYPLIEGELYYKNGRAFVFPVLRGMFERKSERRPAKTPEEAREIIISDRQEFLRCVDYIATRPADFQVDKFAFHGLSSGATAAPIFGALEPRFRAIVAIGGGASTIQTIPDVVAKKIPYYPELDQINFLPRSVAPFLLVNGQYDILIPLETNVKPFMRFLGTPEKDRFLNLYETGHIAISPKSFKDILDFLDKYLGPVN